MKKHEVHVHERGTRYGEPGIFIETIQRKLYAEQFGNFNPILCRYKNQRYQVQSVVGDLSDPFRRDKTYLRHLYIEV